jgi:hypothetical protein
MWSSPVDDVAASQVDELLLAGADAEQRLLREERKAERRLETARAAMEKDAARLRKAQQRLERSRAAVSAAEAELRACQTRRATGPDAGEP